MADTSKKSKTKEEIEAELQADFAYQFLPEPNRFFKLGEEVQVGHLENAVVKDIYLNGKYYLIEFIDKDHRTNQEFQNKRIFPWNNVFNKNSEAPLMFQKDDFRVHSTNTTLFSLINKYYSFGIDMDPDYQRDYVWELKDKVKLIDSIFKNAKIGLFVLNERAFSPTGPLSEIVDGKQRLNAIIEFIEDKFEYNGYKWSELREGDRSRFKDHPIEIAELEKATFEQILTTFLKINRTGRAIEESHLDKVEQMLNQIKTSAQK